MRQGNARFGRCRGGFVLAALALAGHAWAGQVSSVALHQGATGTRAEVQLQGAGTYKTLTLSGPDRLVLDLPDSSAARGLALPAAAGVVTAVRTGQPVPGTLRIVFELSAPVAALPLRTESTGSGARLLIEWPGDGPAPTSPTRTAVAAAVPAVVAAPTSPPTAPPPKDPREDAARATALLTAQVTQALRQPTAAAVPPATAPVQSPSASAGPVATAASPRSILEGSPTAPPAATVSTGSTAAATPQVTPAPVPASTPVPATPPPPVAPPRPAISAAGMRPLVVAIDAGHGGQDPGAIGPTGKREKDVTLAMARELARQINATPGLKAFLVRDSDVFIPLPSRAQRARAAKADIFVSLHADAAENRSARGSSVYVLSTKGASSQRARWLADKENAADLVGGVRLQQTENVLAGVLLDLAQSGHMRASEDAANHVLGGLKRVGNNHKPNIERANFAVLRTSDMPAMLVETAFISNAEEEKRLTDPAYQRKVAGAVVDGINTYFTRQPPPGTLFAARAEAESLAMAGAGGTP
ncbi:N-acetylmuramoyl-L-alanine amidase [Pseudoxanthomonas sp. 10H]|uniref:N-acetylmuramoyl-L-alanine amidase n=1 Tax=Pseudoxanthomonas sp. 10H TaxID=3242729 RepID=UPI0035582A3C